MDQASDVLDTVRPDPQAVVATGGPGAPAPVMATIRLPRGLPGFPDAQRFQIEPIAGLRNGLMRMIASDAAAPAFVVLAIEDWCAIYRPGDLEQAAATLAIDREDLAVFLIVTLVQPAAGRLEAFANLRAPLLLDLRRLEGGQVVLASAGYPLRERLLAIPPVAG